MATQDILSSSEQSHEPEAFVERKQELDRAWDVLTNTPDMQALNTHLDQIAQTVEQQKQSVATAPELMPDGSKPLTPELLTQIAQHNAKASYETSIDESQLGDTL